MRIITLILSFCCILSSVAYAEERDSLSTENIMKIQATSGENHAVIVMENNATAKDFLSILPVTVKFEEIHSREKYGDIDRHLEEKDARVKTYEVGEFVYWDKGPGVAVFYRQGNNEISDGIIRIGHIESGMELFEAPHDIEVRFELINE